jgi:peroxiredoxin
MAIDTGVEAPDFTLKNQDDKEWKLSAHRGKNIVLLFYPLDWSPTCEKENCKISNEPVFSDFKNTVVVGISRDSTWSHKAWKEAKGIKHDLLADPKLEVAKLYDLVHPAGFISHRATVVINKGFNIEHVQVQEKTPEARDLEAIRRVLKAIA